MGLQKLKKMGMVSVIYRWSVRTLFSSITGVTAHFNDNSAEEKKREFNLIYKGKIATNISKLKNYCKAEEFHQKYIEKNK